MSTYSVDPAHSEVGFTVRHMMFAKVRGQFKTWTATVDYDAADPTKTRIRAEIDTASIDTREGQRDGHLKSADFFDSENHPKMVFESTKITPKGDDLELAGDLTIRGVTKPVTLTVERTGAGKDPWGNARLGFRATGSIHRAEWGLTWNQALEAGGVLVSDKVDLDVEVQLVEKK